MINYTLKGAYMVEVM